MTKNKGPYNSLSQDDLFCLLDMCLHLTKTLNAVASKVQGTNAAKFSTEGADEVRRTSRELDKYLQKLNARIRKRVGKGEF